MPYVTVQPVRNHGVVALEVCDFDVGPVAAELKPRRDGDQQPGGVKQQARPQRLRSPRRRDRQDVERQNRLENYSREDRDLREFDESYSRVRGPGRSRRRLTLE